MTAQPIEFHFEGTSGREPPAKLLVIDPMGRRAGVYLRKGTAFDEIPCWKSSRRRVYDTWTGKPARDIIEAVIADPIKGVYEIRLIGTDEGGFFLGVTIGSEYEAPDFSSLKGWISLGNVYRCPLGSGVVGKVQCNSYRFDGFLSPLREKDPRVFRVGDRIPVQFGLKDWEGKATSKVLARLSLRPIDGVPIGKSLGALPGEGRFTYDSQAKQNIYDLRTDSIWAGQWQVKVMLGDGSQFRETFELRERESP